MQGMGIDAKKYNQAGKGAAPRKGAQNEKYRANFDKIFNKGKQEKSNESEEKKHE
jgi:hypothetical protein